MNKNKIICIMIFIILYKYYINYIVKKPKLYYHKCMSNIIKLMPNLHRPVWWTFWGTNSYIQFFIYFILGSYKNKISSNKIYELEDVKLDDNEEIILAWGNTVDKPTGILLTLHTVCGDYSEYAYVSEQLKNELNLIPVSYSRRGHSKPLKNPKFNTVGDLEDLVFVINLIKNKYPNIPIYAIGLSAGSSLLVQYLGFYSKESLIEAAVLISPGYDFEESQLHMPLISSYLATYNVKQLFLYPNKKILKETDKETINALLNTNNITEWHKYQWKFSGNYNLLEEYYKKNNPIYYIENIDCPVLFINALDDIAFPKSLIKKFKKIYNKCKKSIVVHTNCGSHLGFYEGWNAEQWSNIIIKEFFEAIIKK